MQIIQAIRIDETAGSTRRLLDSAIHEHGAPSNMVKTMAHSPLALEGYLKFRRSLAAGRLSPELREQIALTVAQTTLCDYSLAWHAAQAVRLGLTNDEVRAARDARSGDDKTAAALRFARDLITRSGDCSTVELRESGYGEAEVIDLVAQVALYVFENYFNAVAQTEAETPLDAPATVAA